MSRLACASLFAVTLAAACSRRPGAAENQKPAVPVTGVRSVAAGALPTAAAAHPPPGTGPAGQAPAPAVVAPAPIAAAPLAPPPPPLTGAETYVKYCTLCHGPKAEGYAADNAPSLVSATFAATVTDDFLRLGIERGRPGTAMAGYSQLVGGPLNREDIDRLIAHLRTMGPSAGAGPRIELGRRRVSGSAKRGLALYEKSCLSCHGTQLQRANAVHLFNPLLLASASDGFLRFAIENGRPGTRMDAFHGKLPPHAISDVVAYLRSVAPADLPSALAAANAAATGMEPARPLRGPLIINPKGRQAELMLKDDRLVPLDMVKAAFDRKQRIIMVDARTPSDWLRLHITGAISVPYYDMKGLDKLPNDGTWIVAYCACPHHASGVVFDELRKRGYKTTAVLDEGVFAWQQKGYPVVAAPGTLPIPAPPPTPGNATGFVPGSAGGAFAPALLDPTGTNAAPTTGTPTTAAGTVAGAAAGTVAGTATGAAAGTATGAAAGPHAAGAKAPPRPTAPPAPRLH